MNLIRIREISMLLHQLDIDEEAEDRRRREQRRDLEQELIRLTTEADS